MSSFITSLTHNYCPQCHLPFVEDVCGTEERNLGKKYGQGSCMREKITRCEQIHPHNDRDACMDVVACGRLQCLPHPCELCSEISCNRETPCMACGKIICFNCNRAQDCAGCDGANVCCIDCIDVFQFHNPDGARDSTIGCPQCIDLWDEDGKGIKKKRQKRRKTANPKKMK